MNEMKVGFEMKIIMVPLAMIMPVRLIKSPHNFHRYRSIVQSIKEVGLIEPLMVYPQKGKAGAYSLMDGHLRLLALKQLGMESVECLVANEDESYTYNARVSRLPPIQCHRMIVKAVQNGVRPERIAAALDMPLSAVKGMITLLDCINPEAADLLKNTSIAPKAIRLLKKVSGVRQIEIAELMVAANNFGLGYAEALLIGTPKKQMLHQELQKKKAGLTPEQVSRMEREMEALESDFKAIEATYSENMMLLTVARGYIKKLLANKMVVRYLNSNCPEILSEFEEIAAADTL